MPKVRTRRARVSKDEHGHARMLQDAPQRTWAVEAPAFGFRCDAPQHDSEGRRILAKRTQAGSMRASDQPVAAQNDRRRNFIVSGLLFTMRFATHTCRH